MFRVRMHSDLYGGDVFNYATREEAEAGLLRLIAKDLANPEAERWFRLEEAGDEESDDEKEG